MINLMLPTIGLLLLLTCPAIGQIKYEKEYRLKTEAVPEKARDFVEKMGLSDKRKWYKEESQKGTSIEAKTKHDGKYYSVEFSDDGTIEDIEVVATWVEIGETIQEQICTYFSENFARFRIDKIQIQYTGDSEKLVQLLENPAITSQLTIHYEVVVRTRNDGQFQSFECLFDASGEMIQQSKIVQRNLNNIEY